MSSLDQERDGKQDTTARKEYILIGIALLLPILTYLLAGWLTLGERGTWIIRTGSLFGSMIAMVVLISTFLEVDQEKTVFPEKAVWLLMGLGVLLRISYMLYTPCNVRYHDLGELDINSYGHAAYILNIMQEGKLPQTNMGQFYQQPLFYFLGSGISRIINGILGTFDSYHLVDATKVISCMASCSSLLIAKAIFEACGLSGKGLYRALILIAFLPAYFLTGGSVGTDALAGMLMLLALLYTIKWIKCKSWKNTVLLALIYGCGMMTKISCATVAFVTAIVFFIHFLCAVKQHAWKPLLLKYVVFGCISFPLGLWYSIRNAVRFGQPLSYVLEISKENPIYKGDISIFRRIFVMKLSNLVENPYADVWKDYNLPVYALKSSLFGEFRYGCWNGLPVLLLALAFLMACFCVIAMVEGIRTRRKARWFMLMLLSAVIFYGSIVVFYIKYPFGCSMDFRYMLFLPVPIAYIFGSCELFRRKKWECFTDGCCLGFAVVSTILYLSFQ